MASPGQERLRQLYLAHRRRLVRSLSRRLSDGEEAEEVVQEAWARVLSRRGERGIGDLVRYLYRTARNLAIDRLRHRQVESRVLGRRMSFVEDEAAVDGTDARRGETSDGLAIGNERRPGLVLMDGGHSPERVAGERQELIAIAGAINALEPRCRQAFIWHRFHGLGYREIARRLEVSVSSVEKYIMTALVACRETRRAVREGRWRAPASEDAGEILSDLLGGPVAATDAGERRTATPGLGATPDLRENPARPSKDMDEGRETGATRRPRGTRRNTGRGSERS